MLRICEFLLCFWVCLIDRGCAHRVTLLGIAQDASHGALTKEPKSVVLRARKFWHIISTFHANLATTRNTENLSSCFV